MTTETLTDLTAAEMSAIDGGMILFAIGFAAGLAAGVAIGMAFC